MNLESLKPPYLQIAIGSREEFGDYAYRLNYEKGSQFAVRVVRGRKMHRLNDFFNEFAATFQFPEYFGENWDAFEECLADLEWLPATGYVLLVSEATGVLRDEPPRQREIFVRILSTIGQRWASLKSSSAGQQRPFHVVLHCEGAELKPLRGLLKPMIVDVPIEYLRQPRTA